MMFGQLETDTYVWIAILVEYAWSLLYTQHTCVADRDANGMNEQKQLRRPTTQERIYFPKLHIVIRKLSTFHLSTDD